MAEPNLITPNSITPNLTTEVDASIASSSGDEPGREQEPWLRRVFVAGGGLRPGWSIALYLVMFGALLAVGNWLTDPLHIEGLWWQMVQELGLVATAMVPALVMMRIEKRGWGAYGLPLRQAFSKPFWVGAIWGFLGITALLAMMCGMHAFDFGHLALHGMKIAKFAVFWSVMYLGVGLFEEFLLRGYTQFTLARGMGFWPAAAVLSTVFGALHLNNPGEAWIGALAAGFIGFFFCLTLRRTGSLWFAVGFHAAWDWGESFFYSVPDSGQISPGHLLSSSFHGSRWITGGSVGPEGSLLCFLVIAVMWVGFDRIYREAQPRPE